MAIFRGGVKIFGSDVRVGITRDKSLDNIMYDKRFKQIQIYAQQNQHLLIKCCNT